MRSSFEDSTVGSKKSGHHHPLFGTPFVKLHQQTNGVCIFVILCQDGIAGVLKDEPYEGMMHIVKVVYIHKFQYIYTLSIDSIDIVLQIYIYMRRKHKKCHQIYPAPLKYQITPDLFFYLEEMSFGISWGKCT